MVTGLLISIAVLIITLWISVMLLWWRSEQQQPAKTIKPGDVIRSWNKAARLARRSWYGGMRYTTQVTAWGSNKVRTAFIAVFPKSKPAFVKQNPLTGLEHGPSSYFLANLTKLPTKKKRSSIKRQKAPMEQLSVEEKSDILGTPKE